MNENTDRLSDEAFAQHIMQSARTIQPDATFANTLEQKLLQSVPQQKSRPSPQRIVRLLGTIAAVLTLLVIVTFNVPSLRAIAEEIIGLLNRFEDDVTTGYFIEQPTRQLFASLEKAETDLGRKFLVPHYLPSITMADKVIPVEFRMLYYTPERSSVQIDYSFAINSMWFLTFWQTPSEIYYGNGSTSIGASAEVESVTFNFRGQLVSGQFVKGGWVSSAGVPDSEQRAGLQTATPTSVNLEWSSESGQMYLLWEADGVVYQFFTSESRSNQLEINRDELIRIAESIE